eukprot:271675_1
MIPRSYMAADRYTVNAICGYRKNILTGIDEWKVQWEGFKDLPNEFTWEPEENVSHLTLWKEFEQIRTNQLKKSMNKHMLFSSDSDHDTEMAKNAPLRKINILKQDEKKRKRKTKRRRRRKKTKEDSEDEELIVRERKEKKKKQSKGHTKGKANINMHEHKEWSPSRGTRQTRRLRKNYDEQMQKTYNNSKKTREVIDGKFVDVVCLD